MPTPQQLEPESPTIRVWQASGRIPQLDGVRGLAILLVTLYRFSRELPVDSTAGHFLAFIFRFGDRGVDLFFVLSGFLITGVLVQSRGNQNYFRNFFARRSLRIFPLYFASLAALLGLSHLLPTSAGSAFDQASANQFYLWTYLTNCKMAWENQWCFGALDHFWSLAVEEHFYFLWPIVIFLFKPGRTLMLAIVLAAVCGLARIAFAWASDNGVAPDVMSFFRFDGLLLGATCGLLIRLLPNPAILHRPSLWLTLVCLATGLGLSVFHLRAFTVSHSIWALIWSGALMFLLTSQTSSLSARIVNQAWLRKLGKYSYAMYVFQSPLIPLTASILSVAALKPWLGSTTAAVLIYIPMMLLLTWAAAWLSWHVLEKHMLRLKNHFPTEKKSTIPYTPE